MAPNPDYIGKVSLERPLAEPPREKPVTGFQTCGPVVMGFVEPDKIVYTGGLWGYPTLQGYTSDTNVLEPSTPTAPPYWFSTGPIQELSPLESSWVRLDRSQPTQQKEATQLVPGLVLSPVETKRHKFSTSRGLQA